MKIVVTGGCGYIGSTIVKKLEKRHQVYSIDLELFGNPGIVNNEDTFKVLHFSNDINAVIHLASISSVSWCAKDRFQTIETNVVQFLKLAEKIPRQTKFIYASSSCVYGHGELCNEHTPVKLTDDLSISKSTIDNYIQLMDVEYYGMRFGSVNGWSPNLRTDLMINSMDIAAKEKGSVEVFNADYYRPILGTEDLVSSIEAVLACKEDKRGIYNVHSYNAKIGDVARDVAKYHGVKVIDKGVKPTFDFTIDSSKFRSIFGWKPRQDTKAILETLERKPVLKTTRIV